MNVIKICDREFELYYNTHAMELIAEKCGGDISDIGDWLNGGKNSIEKIKRVSEIVAILINGGVQKHNFAIELGFERGEPEPLVPHDVIVNNINPNDLIMIHEAIFNTMAEGTEFKIPDGVDVEKEDEVDADLKAIRERNRTGKN